MFKYFPKGSNCCGFTLIEIMVTVTIIGILTAIVSASFSAAKSNARDKARQADLANLQQGLRLYAEENGSYPSYPSGVEVGVGNAIDADLAPYFNTIPSDPLAGDGVHQYVYDSVYECGGATYVALMATEAETGGLQNYGSVCGTVGLKKTRNPNVFTLIPIALSSSGGSDGGSDGMYTQSDYNGDSSDYAEGTYYSEGSYGPAYAEGSYYSQSTYGPTNTGDIDLTDFDPYIILLN